ncbi:MAG: hypothetical protein ACK5UC_20350, partial [Planctomycetaceae bacterium]
VIVDTVELAHNPTLAGVGNFVGPAAAGALVGKLVNKTTDVVDDLQLPKGTPGPTPKRAAQNGTQAAFDAAQQSWKNLPPDVRNMMHGITNGSRPLSDFTKLPAAQQQEILNYYRATAANASKANAEAVRQLNLHRIDFLSGRRPDPPGGISNFPKPGGS